MRKQTTTSYQAPPEHLPEMIDVDDFKSVFRNHPAGVSIITADAGKGPAGLTATSVVSASANPPILVFSLSTQASAAPTIASSETIVIHMLGAQHLALAKTFSAHNTDRFADRDSWTRLPTGEPILTAATTRIRGRIINRIDVGDSTIIAVQALQTQAPEIAIPPLIYHNRTWHILEGSCRPALP